MKTTHIVEAALFSAGKPLSVEEIATQTNLSPEAVKEACKMLSKEYDGRDSVLEVSKAGAKWAMQVRPQASEPATKFAPPEIPSKLLKTLALIAYHQPMKQSELVDMIGTKVYDHVPELVERGLVKAREEGVTKILVTTALFPEYFGLDAEDREQVRATMAKLVGLPPPAKKTVETVLEQGGANVPEAPAEGDASAAPQAGSTGEGEPGAEAALPAPTTN
jgi:segregation and condensation protein B